MSKVGFENSPAQTAEVKKGSEVRLEFKMKPIAQVRHPADRRSHPRSGSSHRSARRGHGGGRRKLPESSGGAGRSRDRAAARQVRAQTIFANFRGRADGDASAAPMQSWWPSARRLLRLRLPRPSPGRTVAPKVAPPASVDGWIREPGRLDAAGQRRVAPQGGGFLTYKLPSAGVFTFAVYLVQGGNVFRGGRVRWVTDYKDAKELRRVRAGRK